MSLSPPAPRRPLHTRTVTCEGFERDDGLWDIDAHMVDVKRYSFANRDRGTIAPGEALHDMWMRVTCDDGLTIVDAEAQIDDSPFLGCPAIAPAYRKLIGLTIGPGFHRQAMSRLGGTAGCTHLGELLRPLATTAFQTIFPRLQAKNRSETSGGKSPLIDSCYAFRSDGEAVRLTWPAYYTGSDPTPPSPISLITEPTPPVETDLSNDEIK